MKRSLQLVALLLLVSVAAMAGRDRLAEKREAARERGISDLAPYLSKSAVAMWDTLGVNVRTEVVDDIAVFGNAIWLGGWVNGTDEDIVWRSTDGGATFTRKSIATFTNSAGFTLAARDANIALAATWLGDIYRTTDGGANWTMVHTYGGGNGFFDGIKFTGGDSVMAVGDATDATGLYVVKSTDAGATWTRFTNLPTFEATTPNIIASATYHQIMDAIGPYFWITTYVASGTAPTVLRTTNFGESWTSTAVTLTGGLTQAYSIRSINMRDLTTGYLIPRQNGANLRHFFHKTTDGGATWSDTILVERGSVVKAIEPVRGTTNLLGMGYRSSDPKAWWSTDGGTNWTVISPAAPGDGSDLTQTQFVSTALGYSVGYYKALKFTPPGATAVEQEGSGVPATYTLDQNFPNPFNPSTTIRFSIPASGNVTLKVYNLLGMEVATLVNGELSAGTHRVTFDAANLPSGVYFYRIDAGSFSDVRKMALLK